MHACARMCMPLVNLTLTSSLERTQLEIAQARLKAFGRAALAPAAVDARILQA